MYKEKSSSMLDTSLQLVQTSKLSRSQVNSFVHQAVFTQKYCIYKPARHEHSRSDIRYQIESKHACMPPTFVTVFHTGSESKRFLKGKTSFRDLLDQIRAKCKQYVEAKIAAKYRGLQHCQG